MRGTLSGNTSAAVICISIKLTLRKSWTIWWGIFCHCCYYYFVNIVTFLLLHELVLSETLCFSIFFFFFFFFDLSVYKELVIDCNFYILKLNLISFFGTVIIPTSTKNKLIIIIKIWNLWATHLLYLYMCPNTFASEAYWHLERFWWNCGLCIRGLQLC